MEVVALTQLPPEGRYPCAFDRGRRFEGSLLGWVHRRSNGLDKLIVHIKGLREWSCHSSAGRLRIEEGEVSCLFLPRIYLLEPRFVNIVPRGFCLYFPRYFLELEEVCG